MRALHMRRRISLAALALAALAASAPAAAGTASGSFRISIVLTQPGAAGPASLIAAGATGGPTGSAPGNLSATCISHTLNEDTGALVRVVCAKSEFVSIGPRPGRPFLGTQDQAYGYDFGPAFGAIHRTAYREAAGGTGTITSLRVYGIEEADGPLDMLVGF